MKRRRAIQLVELLNMLNDYGAQFPTRTFITLPLRELQARRTRKFEAEWNEKLFAAGRSWAQFRAKLLLILTLLP